MDPIVFEPFLRPMPWGGSALREMLGKPLPNDEAHGESWEVTAHPLHVSRVAEGPLRGQSLVDLVAERPGELFGGQVPSDGKFPLLVKFLDAKELLSIQVHPDDERARRLTNGVEYFGKTEAWVVLHVEPAGRIFAGLRPGVTRDDVVAHLTDGRLEHCLHAFHPRAGDCLFLRAGTVHAVGGGVLMAEVQQSSDATFRLYDWNRTGSDGKPRPLHVEQSLESIDWEAGPVDPVVGTPRPGLPDGVMGERLVTCASFVLDRFHATAPLDLEGGRLSIWIVLEGAVELRARENGYHRVFRRGETVLVPASAPALAWLPGDSAVGATLLAVSLP